MLQATLCVTAEGACVAVCKVYPVCAGMNQRVVSAPVSGLVDPLFAREVFFLLVDWGRVDVQFTVWFHGIYDSISEVGVDVCS